MTEDKSNVDSSKLFDRINRLLNMANDSSSPHEAQIAARRVAKMMQEHNLSMADVIEHEIINSIDKSIITEPLTTGTYLKRIPTWVQFLGCSMKEFDIECKNRFVNGSWGMHIYGYTTDVAVAKYLFKFLAATAQRKAEDYWNSIKGHTTDSKRSVYNNYLEGFAVGVRDEIRRYRDSVKPVVTSTNTSLVVVKSDAIKKRFGDFSYNEKGLKDAVHTSYGVIDGRKVRIDTVIESSDVEVDKLVDTN